MRLLTFTHPHFPAALFDDTHDTRMRYRRADTSRCIVDFLRAQGHASPSIYRCRPDTYLQLFIVLRFIVHLDL